MSLSATGNRIKARRRLFRIWQKTGSLPFHVEKARKKKQKNDTEFFKGAFDSIPFLNDDAKRTFVHLLLRPGYMIRDYIKGAHEIYLAPLTALIIFYAFFTLVCSMVFPDYQKNSRVFDDNVNISTNNSGMDTALVKTFTMIDELVILTRLDQNPDKVDTPWKSSLAALEGNLRSQGEYEFLVEFLLMWIALWLALRRKHHISFSAAAATSAYIICQYSFFMLFAILISLGQSHKIGVALMGLLMAIDLRQIFDLKWKKSIGLTIRIGLLMLTTFISVITAAIVCLALYYR